MDARETKMPGGLTSRLKIALFVAMYVSLGGLIMLLFGRASL